MNNEKEQDKIIGPQNGEIITIEDAEDLISIAQRRVETVQKLINIALKITTYRDWVNQDGQPYLVHSGAEKVARLFGITLSNIKTEQMIAEDSRGKYYIYKTTGRATLPGKFDSIEGLGTCSQRDKFFAKAKGEWLDTLEIDETNIMKASYSNFVVNAITHLLGLRNLTWEQLEEAGIDKSQVQTIEYKSGSGKVSKTLSPKALETRQKIQDMALQITGGEENEIKNLIKECSSFAIKDKETGETKDKFVESVEYLTTEKWINMTYSNMKKKHKKLFPDEEKGNQGSLGV